MAALLLRDLMVTNVKTVFEDDSLRLADWDMTLGEIRHLPVIDRQRRVVGILSDRDILRAAAVDRDATVGVASIMTRAVKTAPPTLPAIEAASRLLESRQSALPVVEQDGVLVGIVTTTDFVELARRALAGLDVHQVHARA